MSQILRRNPFGSTPNKIISRLQSRGVITVPPFIIDGDLLTNLIAYWKLDEASGQRNDSIGTSHLSDVNTVLSAPGIVSTGADFERSTSECLSITDNEALSMGDIDFTIACWVKFEAVNVTQYLVAKYNTGTNEREYALLYTTASNRFQLSVSGDGTAFTSVTATTFGAASADTWYFVVVYHDAANDLIGISINNNAFTTAAHTTGVFDGTSNFNLGALGNTPGSFLDGVLDEVGIWKRKLTANEITQLYNGGFGATLS